MTSTPNTASTPNISRSNGTRFRATFAIGIAGLLLVTGCSASSDAASTDTVSADAASLAVDDEQASTDSTAAGELDLFDSSTVHTISVDFDQADYDAMIETFTSTGDKDWISATVTIDGTTYDDVGLRLKGNSSLFGLTSATSGNPEDLPWLIRLNKFVDGADHQGYEDIVIRSNSTETAMNEAVAQELLALTGLASQDPIATAFTVNGGETELRLAVENPDEEWYEDNFTDEDGLLYKADSEGDYSYRGEDPEAYTDVFDQDVGDDDMQPLIDFLNFINNADDETFSGELGEQLDVEAFATYLAFQDLIGNSDDIDGRGNNSFLQYDTTTEQFTVVSWDLNLAFATANVNGGGAGAGGDVGGIPGGGRGGNPGGGRPDLAGDVTGELGERPDIAPGGVAPGGVAPGGVAPGGEAPVGGVVPGGVGGPGGESNVLVERFMADPEFASLYATKTAELTELLFTSGTVDEVIANWADVLINEASDLVSEDTVSADAAALIAYVDRVR